MAADITTGKQQESIRESPEWQEAPIPSVECAVQVGCHQLRRTSTDLYPRGILCNVSTDDDVRQ